MGDTMKHWQRVISTWVKDTFGYENQASTRIRALRFMEEAIELGQVVGLKEKDIFQLVDKVFAKSAGELKQELGGTIVTLLALTENQGESVLDCLILESRRIHQPEVIKKCQQSEKKKIEARLK